MKNLSTETVNNSRDNPKACHESVMKTGAGSSLDNPGTPQTFQNRVQPWLMQCFGPMIAGDKEERNHRFLEEALELVQACGCTASEAHQLVDYVFNRPVGDPTQEVGGVMVTLAALCLANELDMHGAAEIELTRISVPATAERIRAKQAAKPKHSPLPSDTASDAPHQALVTAQAFNADIPVTEEEEEEWQRREKEL